MRSAAKMPPKRHRRGALDVVVEARDALAVALEQREGVRLREILPLDDRAREHVAYALHELLDELEVGLAREPRTPVAVVERVVEQRLIVGADVEAHRQALRRMEARAGHVEGELADRDAHAPGAEIAETEDALVVGDDQEPDVAERRVFQDLAHAIDVVGRDPDATRRAQNVAELLAGEAHRRGVDDRQQLAEVLDQHAVEEHLVQIVEAPEPDVLLEIARLGADVLELELHLLPDLEHLVRQQAVEAECPALRDACRRAPCWSRGS